MTRATLGGSGRGRVAIAVALLRARTSQFEHMEGVR